MAYLYSVSTSIIEQPAISPTHAFVIELGDVQEAQVSGGGGSPEPQAGRGSDKEVEGDQSTRCEAPSIEGIIIV